VGGRDDMIVEVENMMPLLAQPSFKSYGAEAAIYPKMSEQGTSIWK
jgi:hypothetical protein